MDVRLFRIVTGEEVIAEVVDENASTFTLRNGLVVSPQAQNIGFEVEHSIREKYDSIYGSKLVTPEPKGLILS